ncbi:SRPBCC family protein [Streptosporangiaceae bacterium NEAU-GS5]|nr:SRPBCC family protein [Streptosporangiaceae bacterium NEAU-GS5]
MPESILTHTSHLDASPEAVFDHLTTPENYVGLSPLVVAVRDVDRSEPGVIRYTSVERFRWLVFSYENPIRVALHTSELCVFGEVKSPGGVRLSYRFELSPEGGGTRLDDRLVVSASRLLLGFAAGQARKVQLARSQILASRLVAAP